MNIMCKEIVTAVGKIGAKRDAIFLDVFEQRDDELIFIGEINSIFCEKKIEEYEWYKYCLVIEGVKEYQAINIEDYYKKHIHSHSDSVFFEMKTPNSEDDLKTVVIETYDWAYIVQCKKYDFSLIGFR